MQKNNAYSIYPHRLLRLVILEIYLYYAQMIIKKYLIPSFIFISLFFYDALYAEISLSFTGDVMMGSDYPDESYLPPDEGKNIFDNVSHIFKDSALSFANLEGAIALPNTKTSKSGKFSYSFRMPPYMADRLAEAGFGVVAVANNHARDFGAKGYTQTIDFVEKAGIAVVGKKIDEPLFLNIDNKTIGFLAFYYFSYSNNSIRDINAAKNLIAKTKSECDFLIVSFHGGAEGDKMFRVPKKSEKFYGEDRGDVYKFARSAADSGANLVIGHGPHVLRSMEMYKETFIAYSMGNFVGYKQFSTAGNNGVSAILQITLTDDLKIQKAKITPIKFTKDGIPLIDEAKKAINKLNSYADLDFPDTGVKFDEEGEVEF